MDIFLLNPHMATHTPDSPKAMAALSIEEEASITNL